MQVRDEDDQFAFRASNVGLARVAGQRVARVLVRDTDDRHLLVEAGGGRAACHVDQRVHDVLTDRLVCECADRAVRKLSADRLVGDRSGRSSQQWIVIRYGWFHWLGRMGGLR